MEKKFTEVKDSGKRQDFSTGSKRDTDEGKGNPHLIAGEVFNKVDHYYKITEMAYSEDYNHASSLVGCIKSILFRYSRLVMSREDRINEIYKAIQLSCLLIAIDEGCPGVISVAYTRVAIHYQNGAKKYAANNWRKGQPISRYYDSASRHLWKIEQNAQDEDHHAALLWNLVAIIQTKIDVERGILPQELNDYPFTLEEVFGKTDKEERKEES